MHHAMNRVSATKTMPVITKVMYSVVSIVPQLDARGVNHHGLPRLNTTETTTSTARTSATITACSPCSCSLRMLLRRTGLPDCYPLPEDVSKYTIQCSEISEPGQGLVRRRRLLVEKASLLHHSKNGVYSPYIPYIRRSFARAPRTWLPTWAWSMW